MERIARTSTFLKSSISYACLCDHNTTFGNFVSDHTTGSKINRYLLHYRNAYHTMCATRCKV